MGQHELKIVVAEKEQCAKDLEKALQQLETERLQNEKASQACKQAQAGLRIANAEKSELLNASADVSKQLQELKSRFQETNDLLVKNQAESRVTETKLTAANATIQDLEWQLKHANDNLQLTTERAQLSSNDGDPLRSKREELEMKLSKQVAAFEPMQRECDGLKKKMSEMDLELDLVRKQLKRAQEVSSEESGGSKDPPLQPAQLPADDEAGVQVSA